MPYKKIIDGENVSYEITGALKIWVDKIQEMLELDGSNPHLNYYFCLAALSMGEQARLKWNTRRFCKGKVKQICSLLLQLRENRVFCLDVIDYLSNNMSMPK